MKSMNLPSSFLSKTLSGVVGLGVVINPLLAVQANPVTFVPPNGDKPQDSQGGASRDGGRCPEDDKNAAPYLTPVIPKNAQRLTLKARPTVWVYVPPTTARKAFFSLQDQQNKHHYQTFLPLEKKGGILKIKLPSDAPALTVGTDYKWSFVLICEDMILPDSPTVTGTVRRIPGNSNEMAGKPSLEKAAMLGKAGIWYDMAETMVDMGAGRTSNAQLSQNWSAILRSVDLDAITTKPIIVGNSVSTLSK